MKVTEAYASPINVINDTWKLGADHATPLALVLVSPGFAVELDQYPPAATPRPVRPGDLPPGIAMITFAAANIDAKALDWRVPLAARKGAPYAAGAAACCWARLANGSNWSKRRSPETRAAS